MEALPLSASVRPRASTARLSPCPPQAVFGRRYWLAHCEGYRVDRAEGRLGFVQEVHLGEDGREPAALVVRAGILGNRLVIVPVTEVAFIVPRAERIWLKSSAQLAATEAPGPSAGSVAEAGGGRRILAAPGSSQWR